MEFYIAFGDFKIADLLISNDSVEFPPSWSNDSKFESLLTFFTPEDCCNCSVNEQELIFNTLSASGGQKSTSNASKKRLQSEQGANGEDRFAFTSSPPNVPSSSCDNVNANGVKQARECPSVNGASAAGQILNSIVDGHLTSTSVCERPESMDKSKTSDESAANSGKDFNPSRQHARDQSNVVNGYGLHADVNSSMQNLPIQENGLVDSGSEKSSGDAVLCNEKPVYPPRVRSKPIFVRPKLDPCAKHFAIEIAHLRLVVKPQALVPRGLINPKNWCYVNATLQALLVCPPFFHMLRKLCFTSRMDRRKTSTPIMDSFVLLASEFKTISYSRCLELKYKKLIPGPSFTPHYVYDMLTIIQSSLATKGGQQDAEEFLSCILNGFHEEILSLFDLLYNEGDSSGDEAASSISANSTSEMNGNNLTHPRALISSMPRSSNHTPISNIFQGELCTVVIRPEQKPSESFEPFFTLPIDVPSGMNWSIEDAFYSLTEKENFDRASSKPSVFRHQTINSLPPILILHLKRFIYDKNGGLLKVTTPVYFKTDLTIRNDWLTDLARRKYDYMQKMYKLFAVVYHHGEKATGGHYSTDVFHIGKTNWFRIDDQNIWPIHAGEVTTHNNNRTPYLLYYRQLYV